MSSRWMPFLIVVASISYLVSVGGTARACVLTAELKKPAEQAAGTDKENPTKNKPVEPGAGRGFKMIPAKHRPVMDLMVEIQKVLPPSRVAGGVTVSADVHTSSIIVQGTADDIASVEKIAAELDKPAAMAGVVRDERGTSLRISVYRVNMPQAKALLIKAEELAKTAADDMQLFGALEKMGATRMMYCCDQRVELTDKPAITLAAQVPLAARAAKGKDGAPQAAVSYQDQGMMVKASGGWRPEEPEKCLAEIRMEISDNWPTEIDVGMDPAPPVIQSIKQQFSGPCESGKPVVLLALGSTGMKENVVGYVTRIEIRRTGNP